MKIALRSIDPISKKNKKKNKFAHAARPFVFLCRCFARLQCRFGGIFSRRNCRMCLPKILFPVLTFAFVFSLPLIFTLLAESISHFLTAAKKFSCFSFNEIHLVGYYWVIQSWYYAVLFIDKILKEENTSRNKLLFVLIF